MNLRGAWREAYGKLRPGRKPDAVFATQQLVTDAGGFATLTFTTPSALDLATIAVELEERFGNLLTSVGQDLQMPGSAFRAHDR